MIVGSVVRTDLLVVGPHASTESVLPEILASGFVVVERNGEHLGIVTAADALRKNHVLIGDCVAPAPVIEASLSLRDALRAFADLDRAALAVVDGTRVAGVAVYADVVRALEGERPEPRVPRTAGHDALSAAILGQVEDLLTDLSLEVDRLPRRGGAADRLADGLQRVRGLVRALEPLDRAGLPARGDDLALVLPRQVQLLARGTGATCAVDVVDDLWDQTLDLDAVLRLVGHLVVNACAAAGPAGSVEVRVRNVARTVERGPTVVIAVRDDGPGIPEALRERVFHAGYGTGRGAGLGLAVARALVLGVGGTIALADAPGGGAEVTVTLPALPGLREARRR